MSTTHPPTQPPTSSNNATEKQVITPAQRLQPTKKLAQTEMLPPPVPQRRILENEVTALSNCFRVCIGSCITPVSNVSYLTPVECSSQYGTDLQVSRPNQTFVSASYATRAITETHSLRQVVSTITHRVHRVRSLHLSAGRSKSLISSVTHWSRVWCMCSLFRSTEIFTTR